MIWHMEHRHTGATCFSTDESKKDQPAVTMKKKMY